MKSNLLMFRLPEFCCRNSYISWLLLYLFGAVPQNDLRGSLSGSSCGRKGDPFQGPKLGSCLTLRNDLSEETHVLTKQEIFWEGAPRQRAAGKGTQENCLVVPTAMWLAVSGFKVMELVSGLSLASHLTQSPSWWCMSCSAKIDAREKDSGRWSDMCFLLLTFPELFWLVVAY